jgi:hypothetical protein
MSLEREISSGVHGLMVYPSRLVCERDASIVAGPGRRGVCLSAVAGAGDVFDEARR